MAIYIFSIGIPVLLTFKKKEKAFALMGFTLKCMRISVHAYNMKLDRSNRYISLAFSCYEVWIIEGLVHIMATSYLAPESEKTIDIVAVKEIGQARHTSYNGL